MTRLFILALLLVQTHFALSQTFQTHRVTAWENAGLSVPISAPENQVDITGFGADNSGTSDCSAAYQNALASLNGDEGTIYFPAGVYLFNSSLSIPNDVFLKGESAQTTLTFNLDGTGDLIKLLGSLNATQIAITTNAVKGTYQLELESVDDLEAGDVIRLYQFDEDVMFSSWAYGTLGQVVEIVGISDNTLQLADPLNHHYPISRSPYVRKLVPRRNAGIECLKIIREDATVGQTSNISISNAVHCVIRNVESTSCNFAHLELNSSAHLQIEGNYFHHAHAHGGGGQGYGVAMQTASSFNLVQDNIFEHLRHSMLIQSGANGNVFGYNYSTDPNWTETTLPANSAGDAVLHGNYTYLNLFEGNTVQNMVVDASHGSNGPFNTFFRNRGELFGFFSDSSTPSDSMNIVGNEITSTGFPYGLFIVSGSGHYSFGNNVYGTTNPNGTSNVSVSSLYLNEAQLPPFLNAETLPMAGYPLALNEKLLPAELRFMNDEPISCANIITEVANTSSSESFVQIHGDQIHIDHAFLPAALSIFTSDGRMIVHRMLRQQRFFMRDAVPHNSFLLIRVRSKNGSIQLLKTVY